MDIIKLKALLTKYDEEYYNKDNPSITDEEYDKLKIQYLDLINKEEYNYVPGDALFNKFEHTSPILSLDKVKIAEEDEILKRINKLLPIVIEPKFDGLTIVVYPGPKFITRGNGHIGEDVTENCLQIESLKDIDPSTPLRMEVLMKHKDFKEINITREKEGLKLLKTCRNAASGMLRNEDKLKIKGLTPFLYEVINSDNISHSKSLYELEQQNCDIITPYWKFNNAEQALKFIKNFDRTSLDYDIDGLVVKSDKPNSLKEFGMTEHHPNNAFAIKFKSKGEWTALRKVKWYTGRTGKVVPVGYFDTINILGASHKQATLHNIEYINALGLRINDSIYVIKSHDVIPAIVKCKHKLTRDIFPIIEPTHCPNCNSKLDKINDQLFCRNENCPSRIINKIIHMASREALDITGLSEETAEKIYNKYNVFLGDVPAKILYLNKDMILELDGFADKSATNLYNAFQKAKKISFDRFLYACGIPLLGKKACKDIAYCFGTAEEFADDIKNDFTITKTIEGIGKETIKSIKNNIDLIGKFYNYIEPIPIKKRIQNKNVLTFVITGEFEIPRKDIQKQIEEAGFKITSSVSKKTNYVIVGEKPGSKYDKAINLNISIIKNLDDLNKLLKGD